MRQPRHQHQHRTIRDLMGQARPVGSAWARHHYIRRMMWCAGHGVARQHRGARPGACPKPGGQRCRHGGGPCVPHHVGAGAAAAGRAARAERGHVAAAAGRRAGLHAAALHGAQVRICGALRGRCAHLPLCRSSCGRHGSGSRVPPTQPAIPDCLHLALLPSPVSPLRPLCRPRLPPPTHTRHCLRAHTGRSPSPHPHSLAL